MDEETVLVLTIQLIALSCIAGSLLLYLLCKIKAKRHTYDTDFTSLNVGTGRSVLITSCDTVFGLQVAMHLSALGFRVFAGFKPNDNTSDDTGTCFDGEAGKILRAKLKQREVIMSSVVPGAEENGIARPITFGTMVTLPLDVTREDSLHDAVNIIRRHLPAGEDGKSYDSGMSCYHYYPGFCCYSWWNWSYYYDVYVDSGSCRLVNMY